MPVLADVGVKVHALRHLKLHAKMFLSDGNAGLPGSINLAPGCLDDRRELAIAVRDDAVVKRLHATAHQDGKNSRKLDLSDARLLADLENRKSAASTQLALDA